MLAAVAAKIARFLLGAQDMSVPRSSCSLGTRLALHHVLLPPADQSSPAKACLLTWEKPLQLPSPQALPELCCCLLLTCSLCTGAIFRPIQAFGICKLSEALANLRTCLHETYLGTPQHDPA